MQTEEIVPSAQSTGLDASSSVSDPTGSLFQPQPQQTSSPIRFSQHIQYPIPSLVNMAVKQEPQEEDEQGRQPNALSPQTEIGDAQSTPEDSLANHKRADQASPEFNSQSPQTPQQNGCKKPANRGRRKSRWKLKFHHQALPPEYLDHYEAALAQEAALNSTSAAPVEPRISSPAPTAPMPAFAPGPGPATDVQSWLQRLAAMQNEIYAKPLQVANFCQTTAASRRSVITSTQSTQPPLPSHPVFAHHPHHHQPSQQQHQLLQQTLPNHRSNVQTQPSPRPPMKYSDLPYMGEITLDNSKPRRGRKPKKADICHLIYKNYGTILPGTPGLDDRSKLPTTRDKLDLAKDAAQLSTPYQRTDIQNRISSLLEKRLTQERRALEISVNNACREQEEPLNLCIRDLNLLKIRLGEKHGSAYGSYYSKSEGSSDAEDVEYLGAPTQGHSAEAGIQAEVNGELGASEQQLKSINPNHMHYGGEANEVNGSGADLLNNNHELAAKPNPGFLYWPNAGVFIHPVALQSQFLYYQKLAQEKGLAPPQPPPPEQTPKEQRIVPKSIYSMLESPKTPVPVPSTVSPSQTPLSPETSIPQTPSPRPKRNSTSQGGQTSSLQQPMKRKRSAIFIPPMPTENNNNPATEVSICKFKFTGGAKPTLQEKKSLSVDSGGNFRYYSGTGDKSMRGYEFFPREALQQPANQAGGSSAAGAFLTAAAERTPQTSCPRVCGIQDDSRRKRKTRKSIQREKLEQTFKEKGFLIQTQQLESAEGATYCKFRQLRKFTRYLFRSWKDYLPGNVRELTDSGEPVAGLKDAEQDASDQALMPVSPLPVLPSGVELQPGMMDNSPPSLPLN
ncbi:uncharacterized protein LOC100114177 isoform X2 [Nasonia vitripennis]|nr:uncharacterized protein LOC100114177 isoform X2 [Nasonia vitripennis]XP_031779258.1 uncharacterized protein LOC100114177 isoform X2 [Nasonia vitripennis]